VDGSILVLSLVYAILAAHYSSSVVVVAFIGQISHMLDGDTSIVAQPGVQIGISGAARFLSPVDLQCHLLHWTQLGTRRNYK
jgi:hypothetical protein